MTNVDPSGLDAEEKSTADGGRAPGLARRTKVAIWTASGVAATLIGVAGIVVPMVADAQSRSTSTDTLVIDPTTAPEGAALATSAPLAAAPEVDLGLDVVEVEPDNGPKGPGTDMTFWVPIDAPWASFPDDAQAQPAWSGCTQAQFDWLTTHAVSRPSPGGLLDLVNSATDGGALSVRSIRAEGELVPQSPARITVYCEGGGTGAGGEYTVVKVTLGDASPATVIASSVLPVGSLFTQDLAPGQAGQIFLSVDTADPTKDFEGKIVADVVAGEDESTFTIDDGVLWRSAPSVRAGVIKVAWEDGVTRCVPMPVAEPLFEQSTWGTRSTMPSSIAFEGTPCAPADIASWIAGLPVEY